MELRRKMILLFVVLIVTLVNGDPNSCKAEYRNGQWYILYDDGTSKVIQPYLLETIKDLIKVDDETKICKVYKFFTNDIKPPMTARKRDDITQFVKEEYGWRRPPPTEEELQLVSNKLIIAFHLWYDENQIKFYPESNTFDVTLQQPSSSDQDRQLIRKRPLTNFPGQCSSQQQSSSSQPNNLQKRGRYEITPQGVCRFLQDMQSTYKNQPRSSTNEYSHDRDITLDELLAEPSVRIPVVDNNQPQMQTCTCNYASSPIANRETIQQLQQQLIKAQHNQPEQQQIIRARVSQPSQQQVSGSHVDQPNQQQTIDPHYNQLMGQQNIPTPPPYPNVGLDSKQVAQSSQQQTIGARHNRLIRQQMMRPKPTKYHNVDLDRDD